MHCSIVICIVTNVDIYFLEGVKKKKKIAATDAVAVPTPCKVTKRGLASEIFFSA